MRQLVLDTETTGLKTEEGHKIIEIGCVELVNRKLTGKRLHYYLNPGREIEVGALAVHGITNDFLKDKPLFADIAEEFINFVNDAELIIHNAPFDVGFLQYELKLCQQKWKSLNHYCRITDTLVMARKLHMGQRNSLDALCKRYHVDNAHREFHGALLDAHLLAQVYLAMTGGQGSLFEEEFQNTVTDSNKSSSIPLQRRNLRVIKATAEELLQHEDKLNKMNTKNSCLWLQPET